MVTTRSSLEPLCTDDAVAGTMQALLSVLGDLVHHETSTQPSWPARVTKLYLLKPQDPNLEVDMEQIGAEIKYFGTNQVTRVHMQELGFLDIMPHIGRILFNHETSVLYKVAVREAMRALYKQESTPGQSLEDFLANKYEQFTAPQVRQILRALIQDDIDDHYKIVDNEVVLVD